MCGIEEFGPVEFSTVKNLAADWFWWLEQFVVKWSFVWLSLVETSNVMKSQVKYCEV